MLVGPTGAGKTTLVRQLIGSDHRRDRFPSTSTARTTTADIEIVTADGAFEAAITFMPEDAVRCTLEECLEEACRSVIRGADDVGVASALLEHREQRFRLSYVLGAWPEEEPDDDWQDDFDDDPELSQRDDLAEDEAVGESEGAINTARLQRYVQEIKNIVQMSRHGTTARLGPYPETGNANNRERWLDDFTSALHQQVNFTELTGRIMKAIEQRFGFIEHGVFEPDGTAWPRLWRYWHADRDLFLKHVRWFSSNHDRQFGRLLTPLVDGVRVRGPFRPPALTRTPRLVLLDGEGLGHSAREANSISTRVTKKFPHVEMILLVDNAQAPMLIAPREVLRSVGTGGCGHKLAVAFTHFDQVVGDNLGTRRKKLSHVRASIPNALASLRETLGAAVTEVLKRRLQSNAFFLGGLNRQPPETKPAVIRKLVKALEAAAEPPEPIDLAPIYGTERLDLFLRDAVERFKDPWMGRLGLVDDDGVPKQHWARIKALCRRIAHNWDNNEYSNLRPIADLVRALQGHVSSWLGSPSGWTREPKDEEEKWAAVDLIRRTVSIKIHSLAEKRLVATRRRDWIEAYEFSGPGSSVERSTSMREIYDAAAPGIAAVPNRGQEEFRDELLKIIRDAVEAEGGSVHPKGDLGGA